MFFNISNMFFKKAHFLINYIFLRRIIPLYKSVIVLLTLFLITTDDVVRLVTGIWTFEDLTFSFTMKGFYKYKFACVGVTTVINYVVCQVTRKA